MREQNMNELVNELDKEKATFCKVREELVTILQEDFWQIYEFFQQLFENGYDYIILMSRRCLVLCKIFIRFLLMDEKIHSTTSKLISDQALPYYIAQMDNKKVAVVDDILIHGRTVRKLHRLLHETCLNIKTDIRVYMSDTHVDCISDELKKEIISKCVAYKGEWRSLSNKIVCCIFASNEPYTSFVTSYFVYHNEKMLNKLEYNDNIEVVDITGIMQKHYGLTAKYLYEKEGMRHKIFSWLSLGEGVRIYWNKEISKLTLIPYVFIRCLDLKESKDVFDKIESNLPNTLTTIKKALKDDGVYNGWIEYKMRLVTCILSNIYWIVFKKKYQIIDDYYVDFSTLNQSFGNVIAKELDLLTYENVSDILQLSDVCKEYRVIDNTELSDVLEDASTRFDNWGDILKGYFQKAWYIDERRAMHLEERYNGFVLDSFIKKAIKCKEEMQYVLANMISIWDNGLATANFSFDESQQLVGCYISPGEQSYKILIEKYPYLIMMLNYVSKMIQSKNIGENISDEEYINYREEKLLDFVAAYNEKFELEDYESIVDIIKYEKGYLNAWNQSAIIKRALPFDKRQDNEFVKKYIELNL